MPQRTLEIIRNFVILEACNFQLLYYIIFHVHVSKSSLIVIQDTLAIALYCYLLYGHLFYLHMSLSDDYVENEVLELRQCVPTFCCAQITRSIRA